MSHAYYSLYCKQRELEQKWEFPWACGFASLVTSFRILGDRTTENDELVARFRSFGEKPQDGMTTDEATKLAHSFGYRAARNPPASRRDSDRFIEWIQKQWIGGRPIMVSVDSHRQQGEANHWWLIYGDPEESNIWVMDPLIEEPFELLPLSEIVAFAACNDGEGFIEYDGVAVSTPADSELTAIPPSAELMNFLNGNAFYNTGWTSQAIAAALVDNHFSSLAGIGSQGKARGGAAVSVSHLVEEAGPVVEVIRDWDAFFSDEQSQNMDELRRVLYDLEAHQDNVIAASEADHMTREVALNLILIGTNLMDG